MPELPRHPWGICPVLFHIGGIAVPAYGVFILLGLIAAALSVWHSARRSGYQEGHAGMLLLAALVGGTLGAKLPVWLMHGREILAAHSPEAVLSGRTVVGGLIGGTLAVVLARRWLGLRSRSGNLFAPALALGIAIGRWGCFCVGCCFGVPTGLPWGVNFGDGILRHPTQIYESLYALGLFAVLKVVERRGVPPCNLSPNPSPARGGEQTGPKPGALFRAFMLGYFSFRFLIEFLRTDTRLALGLTLAQYVSLGVVLYYGLIERPERDAHG
jgi:phosphatidylglycerol:prolipoprotein diacylglycerol transferase